MLNLLTWKTHAHMHRISGHLALAAGHMKSRTDMQIWPTRDTTLHNHVTHLCRVWIPVFQMPTRVMKTRKTDLHIPCLSCSCDFVKSCTCVEKRQLHHQTQTATLFSTSLAQLLQGWGHLTHRFDGPCGSASPASSDVKKSWLCDFLIVACDLYATTERSSSTWSNNMYNFTFSVLIHCCVWIPLAWCGNCI